MNDNVKSIRARSRIQQATSDENPAPADPPVAARRFTRRHDRLHQRIRCTPATTSSTCASSLFTPMCAPPIPAVGAPPSPPLTALTVQTQRTRVLVISGGPSGSYAAALVCERINVVHRSRPILTHSHTPILTPPARRYHIEESFLLTAPSATTSASLTQSAGSPHTVSHVAALFPSPPPSPLRQPGSAVKLRQYTPTLSPSATTIAPERLSVQSSITHALAIAAAGRCAGSAERPPLRTRPRV